MTNVVTSNSPSGIRDAILADCVRAVGAAWVETWRDALRRERRHMEGGWPGTIGEARALVMNRLKPELARHGLAFPTPDELTRISRETYATARRTWLASATPED